MTEEAIAILVKNIVSEELKQPQIAFQIAIIAGIFALIVSIITIITAITNWLKNSNLELKLTNEVFLRLSSDGECVFTNAVLLARDGDVEIRSIELKLKRSDIHNTEYTLRAKRFGEKVKQEGQIEAQHYFYTTSPISFVTSNTVQRQLCLSAISEYDDQIQTILTNFDNECYSFLKPYKDKDEKGIALTDPEKDLILNKLEELRTIALMGLLGFSKIEDGEYNLKIILKYRSIGPFYKLKKLKECNSTIKFRIRGYRASYEVMIDKMLRQIIYNNLNRPGDSQQVVFPQYVPSNIEEVS